MARRARLDAELVRRGLAKSREQAVHFIDSGRVSVDGLTADKASRQVDPAQAIVLASDTTDPGYASRGAYKLISALDAFDVDVTNRICLDAGASTGGFTDVLLRRGATHVTALDVGYGQLVWELRNDPRVTVMDRTNIRHVESGSITPAPNLIVADLSFISLTLVLPALVGLASEDADLLLMVKPQFEVGRERVGSRGVVTDPLLRAEAVRTVAEAGIQLSLGVLGVVASGLPGPSGNVEFFIHFTRSPHSECLQGDQLIAAITKAVENGPQTEKGNGGDDES